MTSAVLNPAKTADFKISCALASPTAYFACTWSARKTVFRRYLSYAEEKRTENLNDPLFETIFSPTNGIIRLLISADNREDFGREAAVLESLLKDNSSVFDSVKRLIIETNECELYK